MVGMLQYIEGSVKTYSKFFYIRFFLCDIEQNNTKKHNIVRTDGFIGIQFDLWKFVIASFINIQEEKN